MTDGIELQGQTHYFDLIGDGDTKTLMPSWPYLRLSPRIMKKNICPLKNELFPISSEGKDVPPAVLI